jgi:OOP family OmpA-OmpF porin
MADRIGSIVEGKSADLVAIDLAAPELLPVNDTASQIVHAVGREHVTDVWIAGRRVVEARQLADSGASTLRSEVAAARTRVWHNRIARKLSGAREPERQGAALAYAVSRSALYREEKHEEFGETGGPGHVTGGCFGRARPRTPQPSRASDGLRDQRQWSSLDERLRPVLAHRVLDAGQRRTQGLRQDLVPSPTARHRLRAPAPHGSAPPLPPAPAPAPAPAPVPAAPTSEKVTFAADALFDFDKSVVKAEGKAKLDDLVGKLEGGEPRGDRRHSATPTASAPTTYNQKLSVRRADAVKALPRVSKGIEANRIYTEGKGEKQPVADNKTAEGRAKNRRVEIEVVGTRPRQ